jgi:hypothetical protein
MPKTDMFFFVVRHFLLLSTVETAGLLSLTFVCVSAYVLCSSTRIADISIAQDTHTNSPPWINSSAFSSGLLDFGWRGRLTFHDHFTFLCVIPSLITRPHRCLASFLFSSLFLTWCLPAVHEWAGNKTKQKKPLRMQSLQLLRYAE